MPSRLSRLPALCALVALAGACDPGREPSARGRVAPAPSSAEAPPSRWCAGGRPTALAAQAVALLRGASDHGLIPSAYDAEGLAAWMDRLAAAPAPGEAALFEEAIGVALERYLTDLHQGRIPAREAGFDYHPGERHRVPALIAEAAARGDLAALIGEAEPDYPQYRRLVAALARHRALDTGDSESRVRRIELALERLRWLPHAPPGRFLVANVPAFRLVAFDRRASDDPILVSPVVVGEAARERTPFFIDAIRTVTFRPFWYPPRSIIQGEILPALQRDPEYLARERLDLVARGADDAPALRPTRKNLARVAAGTLLLRQQPGPRNMLGLVKFGFPNRYDVYLHDTPAKDQFERRRRDLSHGCIRVEKPVELAAFVLAGMTGWSPEMIHAAMQGERTYRVELSAPVPIFIYYTTAIALPDGTVEFFDDIYGLDPVLDAALGGPAMDAAP